MFFAQDKREVMKAEHPSAKFGDLGKMLGAAWNELEGDDKKVEHHFYVCI
jgi:hypothetical protein